MHQTKVKWGILGAARIGIDKVIPAMQQAKNIEIVAIASRDAERARKTAEKLNIPNYYDNYQALLNNHLVEAVYIPLPNHLHFEWIKKAILQGKHVLCEKPLTISSSEINELISLRNQTGMKVGEAFMVHTHPQWLETVRLIKEGALGSLRVVQGFFSYFKTDPTNIRNILEYGGGAMWDIGCYPVHTSRYVFGEEPVRVVASIDRDPVLKIDRLSSVIMDFPSGQATFTVGTQLVPYQKMHFFGDRKKIEIEIPFNAPNDRNTHIFVDDGDLFLTNRQEVNFESCDQYTIQGALFSEAIILNQDVPVSLEDAYNNTRVIEAIFRSADTQSWVEL